MNTTLKSILTDPNNHPRDFWSLSGVDQRTAKSFILGEVRDAAAAEDEELAYHVISLVYFLADYNVRVEILNQLLIMPGHREHQPVTKEIQDIGSPDSIPYIVIALDSGFDYLQYTCSEDGVITKWFSHALASIGTDEAIDLIKKYSKSSNPEIAKEMSYRLKKCRR